MRNLKYLAQLRYLHAAYYEVFVFYQQHYDRDHPSDFQRAVRGVRHRDAHIASDATPDDALLFVAEGTRIVEYLLSIPSGLSCTGVTVMRPSADDIVTWARTAIANDTAARAGNKFGQFMSEENRQRLALYTHYERLALKNAHYRRLPEQLLPYRQAFPL